MSQRVQDRRLDHVEWRAYDGGGWLGLAVRVLVLCDVVLAAWYLAWLLNPNQAAHGVLYGFLVGAEVYNLVQGVGFWWTVAAVRPRSPRKPVEDRVPVDVFIPVFREPVEVVEATVAAAMRLRTAEARVALLDDGGQPEMEELARRYGARYLHRPGREGAKAGNINWALQRTDAPFVAVLDCDHVADPRFLEVTLAYFDERVAFVQTPQYYANGEEGGVASASWDQQDLFFGTIAVGRDHHGAMFCCGTNVVFRRAALEDVGGFSTESLTEDFELSIRLHERGWQSRYVPEVLAAGLGPEDMASYVGQQLRWARGCLWSLPAIVTARLSLRHRLNYLLSAVYWMTGWTLLVYMAFPVIRILTGEQPIDVSSVDEFLLHWAPYFVCSMATVALSSRGRFSFSGFALMSCNFWIHMLATLLSALRRKGTFKVTPKQGAAGRQLRPVFVPLLACLALSSVATYGLIRDQSPATLNNVAFAFVHISVLLSGVWPALFPSSRPPA